ncbi:MAG: flagellar hook-basal body complex protein [Oscillospiraceae bacterium]|nr:flagellar hook-basal body complex protein [Oscillospiraceae bacterium]
MIRSLYSGVSGLTSHQTKMDVIGNNIANVNTYGFKSSRTSFSDIYYQSVKSATAGSETYAGNNPSSVGYGVQVASIDKDMSQSSFQSTNRTLDLAISGDGFFALGAFSSNADGSAPADTASPDSLTYTRNGNFGIDSAGNLVSNDNRFVLGTRNSTDGLHLTGDASAKALAAIGLEDNNGDNKITSSDYTYENTININDLIQEAYGIYTDSETGYLYTDRVPVPVTKDRTVTDDDGNTTTITEVVGFTQGEPSADGTLYLCDINGNYITYEPSGDDTALGVATYTMAYTEDDGTEVEASIGYLVTVVDDSTETGYAFEADGDVDADDPPLTLEEDGVLGTFTYADLSGFTIGSDGVITVTYNNQIKAIARIEITVFDNPEGLLEVGDTSYSETTASGAGKVKSAGDEGAGTIASNKLEMSNVNLAQEFSDMIVTQRGFQANARIITTSDTMLEELVNLKRS